ncbi:glycosyltransferase family 4 protein [Phyllobacterium endophyticum]|uniref:glycosyltransferase family 4 protein n=1 Tax=Phyllobacterium endophyticum TaxID=1149773 RepID=UPI0011CC35C7|nr:glycosyltransferase family 4 protein [Phyllobacterium endophyticum]TXR50093.1 glycosyltransferase family 4 protein [Phyllobacterium endophyticum]
MKIVVFTPALKQSAIGRSTALVTKALVAKGHEVTVVRVEMEKFLALPAHDFGAPLIAWNNKLQVEAALADSLAVYQIGNHYPYHEGCLEWLPENPGIVCLHDYYLGNLFHSWAESQVPEAQRLLRSWYGDAAALSFFGYKDIESFIEGTRRTSPMTEWICAMASGVIAHSAWDISRVLRSCAGPVSTVALAYDRGDAREARPPHNERFVILTVGNITENKRSHSMIKAIGSSNLRKCIIYRMVGSVTDTIRDRLETQAVQEGVEIELLGHVDDDELAAHLQDADVVSCLRWPVLESASATAIEALLHGKPTIVTDAGFYLELPDECVIKVDPNKEVDGIRSALETLHDSEARRLQIGSAARQYAETMFSADKYADRVIGMADAAIEAKKIILKTCEAVNARRRAGALS